MLFVTQILGEDVDAGVTSRHQGGMGIQPHCTTQYRSGMIDKEIGQVRSTTTEAHAHRRPCPRQHRHFWAGGHLASINLAQPPLRVQSRQGIEAQIKGFQQLLA